MYPEIERGHIEELSGWAYTYYEHILEGSEGYWEDKMKELLNWARTRGEGLISEADYTLLIDGLVEKINNSK